MVGQIYSSHETAWTTGKDAETLPPAEIAELRERLDTVENQLARLAVVHGLTYGRLEALATTFLELRRSLNGFLAGSGNRASEALAEKIPPLQSKLQVLHELATASSSQRLTATYRAVLRQILDLEPLLWRLLQSCQPAALVSRPR